MAAVLTLAGTMAIAVPSSRAQSAPILNQQGTLKPAVNEYPIVLEAGQVLTIRMSSEEFDTVLLLLAPNGEEVAFNDDADGSLNSRIVYMVPETGQYTIVARSYGGNGGDYLLQVQPATAYEVLMNEADMAIFEGDYDTAIAALSEAINLEPNQPSAYVQRANLYWSQAYQVADASGQPFEGPMSLPEAARNTIASDFLAAAALYEASGDVDQAAYLRAEAEFVQTGEYPAYPGLEIVPEG
ncbi:PPC domain-containing protein [Leptolyngbya sp. PCC 6406]|uniref:PPC domain-containing protein n=1 Tax=Leptolyngbya sp. PCC 6406 TaxID=1173264 RepID=UPI00138AF01C|nr:tetratricopeptide repeat protein [Leptolyngbya sp. PCC 6406]